MKFKVIVNFREVGEYYSLAEALRNFFSEIINKVREGVSLSFFNTCYISRPLLADNGHKDFILTFYKARDLAYSIGMLKDQKLSDNYQEISDEDAFIIILASDKEVRKEAKKIFQKYL